MAQISKIYEPSTTIGFLEPVARSLADKYYKPWDDLAVSLPDLLRQKKLREHVNALDVLSIDHLRGPPEWRRAHSLLSFLLHAYIWEDLDHPRDEIPTSISEPFTKLSDLLGVPFTQSYADLVLWNWTPKDESDVPTMEQDDLTTLFSFTGTKDEEWFHLGSIAVEAKGSQLVKHLLRAVQAIKENDVKVVSEEVRACVPVLAEIRSIMRRINEHCSPEVFYHQLSPYLAGSNALPNGIHYNDAQNLTKVQIAGGSNAMTSLIPLCDMILGVEHDPQTQKFFEEMRKYMPTPHREFLQSIQSERNVVALIKSSGSESLHTACKECVESLRQLRSLHIQIATQYLVIPGRKSQPGKSIQGTASQSPILLLQRSRNSTSFESPLKG